jgi:hypothetical protein
VARSAKEGAIGGIGTDGKAGWEGAGMGSSFIRISEKSLDGVYLP